MAEHEKQLSGSPVTATGVVTTTEVALTTARLVATGGGPCTVTLFDETVPPTDVYQLVADTVRPDMYKGTANRKLRFTKGLSVAFVAGTGKLYLYFT